MTTDAIHRGQRLAPNEAVVWQGSPAWRRLARDVYHLDWIAAYCGFLLILDAVQAWSKSLPLATAVHNSVPLVVICGFVLVLFSSLAWMTGRTTRYTVTSSRVIMDYGIAISATLSIPYSRIATVSVAVNADHTGDIPLALRAGDRMPFLKLWPHARPFRLAHPEPTLRSVPQAAVVSGLLTRAIQQAMQDKERTRFGSADGRATARVA